MAYPPFEFTKNMTGIIARFEVLAELENNHDFIGSFEQSTIDVKNIREAYTDRYDKRVNYLVCDVFNPEVNVYEKVYIIDNETKQLTQSDMGFLALLADYSKLCAIDFSHKLNINFGQNRIVKMTLEKCLVVRIVKKNYTESYVNG